jgi:hypothetical protein
VSPSFFEDRNSPKKRAFDDASTRGTPTALCIRMRSPFIVVASAACSLFMITGCSSSPPSDGSGVTSSNASEKLSLGSYDPNAAVAYADANWNNGQGECAEFTTRSLRAGNLDIDVITWVPDLFTALSSLHYEEHTQGASGVSAAAGDVVIYSDATGNDFCEIDSSDESNCGHVCIVTVAGSSENGIEVDCHNNAHYHLALGDILGSGYSSYRIYHLAGSTSAAPPGTEACSSDDDCNGGRSGTQIVCGSSEDYCIKGCHSDNDCPSGTTCAKTAPHWSCQ